MVNNQDFLPPIQTNEFLPPISRWTTWGGMFILCVIGLAVPVSAAIKYKVTVKGNAVVRPAGELRIVQAAIEGQIIHIDVKENQTVKKGDTIAKIDDSRLQTKKSQLETNIGQAKLQRIQINAQINALNSQIQAEAERIDRIIRSAQAQLRGRKREYEQKKITTVASVQEADANISMAVSELEAAKAQLQTSLANLEANKAALGAARSKQKRYESIASQGALSKDQLEEAQLAAKQQAQAVKAQFATVEVQKQTIERLQKAVSAAIARKQRSQAALNPSKAEVAIAMERIAQEKASGESNKATLEKERQALIKQRIEVEKQLERDRTELSQVEMELNHTTIKATEEGIISELKLRNPGQTVRAGEQVVRIVPSQAAVVIKASVGSEDKNKLKLSQKVQMRVSACPYPDYGTLNGKVQAISPDAITPEKNGDNGYASGARNSNGVGAFYEVTVKPEKLVLGKGKNLCHIQLGMQGRADIISREETVLRFFLRKARLIADL